MIIVPGFSDKQKTENEVERTGNETGREYLENSSNDFLQIRYMIIFLLVFYIF